MSLREVIYLLWR